MQSRIAVILTASVFLNLCTGSWACAQIASSLKPADDLLFDFFLNADEISDTFCVKITGDIFRDYPDSKIATDTAIIVAECSPQKASYVCYGEREGAALVMTWQEVLDVADSRLFKRTVGELPSRAYDRLVQAPGSDKPAPKELSLPTKLNPFALVLAAEADVSMNVVTLDHCKKRLTGAEFLRSTNDKDGNVIGEWLILPVRFAIVQILFSARDGYQPTKAQYFHQQDGKPVRDWFGSTTISWQRYGNGGWVPVSIQMEAKHPGSFKAYRQFELNWLNHELIKKEHFSFDQLVTKEPSNWRTVFLSLFAKKEPTTDGR